MNEIYLKWDPSRERDATLGLRYDSGLILRAVATGHPAHPLGEIHIGRKITHIDGTSVSSKEQIDKMLWQAVDRVAVRFHVPYPRRISPVPPDPSPSRSPTTGLPKKQPSTRGVEKAPPSASQNSRAKAPTVVGVAKAPPSMNSKAKAPPPPSSRKELPPPPPPPAPSPVPSSQPSPVAVTTVAQTTQTDFKPEVRIVEVQAPPPPPPPPPLSSPSPERQRRRELRREKRAKNDKLLREEQAAVRKMQHVVNSLGAAMIRYEGNRDRMCPRSHTMKVSNRGTCSVCRQHGDGLYCDMCHYKVCWACAPAGKPRPKPMHCVSIDEKPPPMYDTYTQKASRPRVETPHGLRASTKEPASMPRQHSSMYQKEIEIQPSVGLTMAEPPALKLASVIIVDYEMTKANEGLGDHGLSGFELPEGMELSACEMDMLHRKIPKVPVLRVFGRTEAAESALVRVHGMLPYIYIPWPAEWPSQNPQEVRSRLLKLSLAIEEHPASGPPPVLHSAFLVQGIPFYGYHHSPRLFIKLYLINPGVVPAVAAVLGGTKSILGLRHQPYHAHFPYVMQCMVDLRLAGMASMTLTQCTDCFPKNAETAIAVDCKRADVLNSYSQPISTEDLKSSDALLVSTLTEVWAALETYRKNVLQETNVTQKQTMGSPVRTVVPDDDAVQKIFRDALSQLRRNVSDMTQTQSYTHDRLIPATPKQLVQGLPWCDCTYEQLVSWIPSQHSQHNVEPLDCTAEEDDDDIHGTLQALRDLRNAFSDDPDTNNDLGLEDQISDCSSDEMESVLGLSAAAHSECHTSIDLLKDTTVPLGEVWRSDTLDAALDGGLHNENEPDEPFIPSTYPPVGHHENPIDIPQMTQIPNTQFPSPEPFTPESEGLFPESKDTKSTVKETKSELKETPQVINIRQPSVGEKRPRDVDKELFPDSESSRSQQTTQTQSSKLFSLSTHSHTQQSDLATQLSQAVPHTPEVTSDLPNTDVLFAATPKPTVRFTEPPVLPPPPVSAVASSFLQTLHPKDRKVNLSTTEPPSTEELMMSNALPKQPVLAKRRVLDSVLRKGVGRRYDKRVVYEAAMPPPTAADLLELSSSGSAGEKAREYKKHLKAGRDKAHRKPLLSLLTQATAMASKSAAQAMHQGSVASASLPYMLIACLEVLPDCSTMYPDPSRDPILACALNVHNTNTSIDESTDRRFLVVVSTASPPCVSPASVEVATVPSEEALIVTVLRMLRKEDPDILLGWDLQRYSYGYLNRRAALYGVNLPEVLGRVASTADKGLQSVVPQAMRSNSDDEMFRVVLNVKGRVTLNLWRTLRSELKLPSYTICAVAKAALGVVVPKFSHRKLADWAKSGPKRTFAFQQLLNQAIIPLRVANHLDVINRTVELARLYGVQFTDVITRGAQFKVENMFTRLATPLHYVMVTPSKTQVERQNRQEGIPLVMEPHSGYYTDPVIVLDFRSLYPSIIIAYNLCFSTCLGKLTSSRCKKLGAINNYMIPKEFLKGLPSSDVVIAPNSCAFVKPSIKRGVFPRLLSEILSTRFAVQESLKKARTNKDVVMEGILHARQVGLKMIANVTYGYSAATMSGRMPCSDIADAIVLLARKTLETAIHDVRSNPQWKAKVIYGDTDSLFVCLPGATLERAFQVGKEIVAHVAAGNPSPVKLKLEKVYSKCMLVTKKRYVGYAHDGPTAKPVFEAKGLECIRRDQCRTTQKVQEMALRTLFDTNDVEAVKQYVQRQLVKVQAGDVNVHDLILRQEVKLGTYANPNQVPPSATVAREMMKREPLAEPLYNERVPYIVINSVAARLSDMVMHPAVLLSEKYPSTTLNGMYYITKQICPPLERVMSLAGGDVKEWVLTLPKVRTHGMASSLVRSVGSASSAILQHSTEDEAQEIIKCATRPSRAGTGNTLHSYYASTLCIVCKDDNADAGKRVCRSCLETPDASRYLVSLRRHEAEKELNTILQTCAACVKTTNTEFLYSCNSLDCEVPWKRQRAVLSVRDACAACDVQW